MFSVRAEWGGELEPLQPFLLPATSTGKCPGGAGAVPPQPRHVSQTGDTSQALPQLWGQLGQQQTQWIQAVLLAWAAANVQHGRLCQDFCPEPWGVPKTLSELQEFQIPECQGGFHCLGACLACTSPNPLLETPKITKIPFHRVHTLKPPQRFARDRLCHEPSAAKISMKMVVFHKRKICGCP